MKHERQTKWKSVHYPSQPIIFDVTRLSSCLDSSNIQYPETVRSPGNTGGHRVPRPPLSGHPGVVIVWTLTFFPARSSARGWDSICKGYSSNCISTEPQSHVVQARSYLRNICISTRTRQNLLVTCFTGIVDESSFVGLRWRCSGNRNRINTINRPNYDLDCISSRCSLLSN